MTHQPISCTILGATLLAIANSAPAAVILGNIADSGINNSPVVRTITGTEELVKAGNIASAARNVVFVFQLPTLGIGESFGTVDLSFTLLQNGANSVPSGGFVGGVSPTFNIDLYGLGRRTSSGLTTDDRHFGATVDPTDATLLQADFITSTTSVGTTSYSGSSLVSYLNSQYAGGAGAGEFVFLRLNPDVAADSDTTNNMNYRISMADNTGATAYAKITPQLNYTMVPETSTTALLGLGILILARRRSR